VSPDVKVIGNSLFVTWLERVSGSNKLFFVLSGNKGKTMEKPVELATQTKAMWARILIDKERLYVLEALPGKEPEVFINLSSDRGSTFKRVQLETEGLESLYHPSPLVIDNTLYIFFLGVKGDKKYFAINEYEIPSMKLKDSILFRETEGISFIEAFIVKQNPVAIYKTMNEGKFVLEGVMKRKTGWEGFSINETKGLDVARMDFRVWEDGRILIVFSGEERGKFKQRIYAAVSEDEGKNWGVRRIDKKEFDNTRSWLPRMAVDGNKVAVVWEDSRDIRSGTKLKLSQDRGKTWIERDTTISNTKNYAFRPRISFSKKFFYFAWHQFRDDERNEADLAMLRLKWDDAVKIASKKERVISLKKKETLLRKRVSAYWKGMIEKDLKTTYEIHDPFYKARIPFDYYKAHRGPMVYHSYKIEDVKIEDNIATVKIKVNPKNAVECS
jgi:hypothetical protein